MPTFTLWRQDDNGNRFLVGTFANRAEAVERLTGLSAGQHKQTYWISEEEARGSKRNNGQPIPGHSRTG